MQRIWIIGASGSGKSTLARKLSSQIGASCVDLDELHWRPNWQTSPETEFLAALEQAMQEPSWVIAGNYSKIQGQYIHQADTILWLDYGFPVVLWQLIRRTWRRAIRGESCCNGNYESLRLTFSRESIVLWLFQTYNRRRRAGWNTKRRARKLGMNFLHFRHPNQCARWVQAIGQTETTR